MSRSNYDKPFYVDVGTSIVAIRCASNHDVVCRRDHVKYPFAIELMEEKCDRMNREFELSAKRISDSICIKGDWSVKEALQFANTLANRGWTRDANADAASSCIYALCRMLKDGGNAAAMREAGNNLCKTKVLSMDEAIEHCKECIDGTPCGENHRQLAEWLTELKAKSTGNAAEIREALNTMINCIEWLCEGDNTGRIRKQFDPILLDARSALTAPPRNCDLPLVVDGPADNNADKAWLLFKKHNPDAYFDVSGLLRCIDWLLATAKKEGGAE